MKGVGRVDKHDFQLFMAINDIGHTKTRVKSPRTNGICERFHKAILQELCDSIDALQADLSLAAPLQPRAQASGQNVLRQNAF